MNYSAQQLTNLRLCLMLALLLTGLTDCKKNTDDPDMGCQPPTMLTAQAPCESGYQGVLLLSQGYQANNQTQFCYYVYPQKDTLLSDLTVKGWADCSNQRILVPETAIGAANKFLVRVTINCAGREIPSRYFAYVKRSSRPGCYIWALKNL